MELRCSHCLLPGGCPVAALQMTNNCQLVLVVHAFVALFVSSPLCEGLPEAARGRSLPNSTKGVAVLDIGGTSHLHGVGVHHPRSDRERVSSTTFAPGTGEYQCASQYPSPHGGCESCTTSSTCKCNGLVRMGYNENWSTWVKVSGEVKCSTSIFSDALPGHGKICICKPEAYICAKEAGATTPGCNDCMQPSSLCSCVGEVRFGDGDTWSEWFEADGTIDCVASTFGSPGTTPAGSSRRCECRSKAQLQPLVLPRLPVAVSLGVDTITASTVTVSLVYFAVYAGLAILRWKSQFSAKPAGTWEAALESSAISSVYFANMLCPVFLSVSKRVETLTAGNPLMYDYPPRYLQFMVASCTAGFVGLSVCHACGEAAAASHGTKQASAKISINEVWAVRTWRALCHLCAAIMYGSLAGVLMGVATLEEPAPLLHLVGRLPLSAGTACTICLASAYFTVYLVLYVLKSQQIMAQVSGGSVACFGVEVMKLAATAVYPAPMLSVAFLGAQISADWQGVDLPHRLRRNAVICTSAVVAQVALVIIAPFAAGAELQTVGPRGELDFVARKGGVPQVISTIRWLTTISMYVCIAQVWWQLSELQAVPVMTVVLCRFFVIYFAAYLLLWVTLTIRSTLLSGLTRLIRILTVVKDTVGSCPMLAVLTLASWVHARRTTSNVGYFRQPQPYVQEALIVATYAIVLQLSTVVASGIWLKSPVNPHVGCQPAWHADLVNNPKTAEEKRSGIFLAIHHVFTLALYTSVGVTVVGLFTMRHITIW